MVEMNFILYNTAESDQTVTLGGFLWIILFFSF